MTVPEGSFLRAGRAGAVGYLDSLVREWALPIGIQNSAFALLEGPGEKNYRRGIS